MTKQEKTLTIKLETALYQFHKAYLNLQEEAAIAKEGSQKRRWLRYAASLILDDLNTLKRQLPTIEYVEVD